MNICCRKSEQLLISLLRKQKHTTCAFLRDNCGPLLSPSGPLTSIVNVKHISDGRKSTLINNLLNLVTQTENFQNDTQGLSPRLWKPHRHIRQLLPHLFSEDGQLLPTATTDAQLKGLMMIWELDEAVNVLKTSVSNGCEPNSDVVLDLLQQLANMGEVDHLLDLHELLKERSLTTNLRFYQLLCDAYFNSGRIEEGVVMLRMVYHRTRDFSDTDMFFTLLTTMIIKHFEHHLPLIESFVTDLEGSDPPEPASRASLWRCHVLTERFEAADEILASHEHLKKMVPEQVTKIVQSPLQMNYNKSTVLLWLLQLPYIKQGLKASVFDALINHKSEEGEWIQALELLSTAMDQGMKIHQQTVQVFLTKFLCQLSPAQVQQLTEWTSLLETVSDTDGS